MQPSLLITQCLQNDFVQPIRRFEPIPNRLHVGFAEAQRLMGETPEDGPVARVMRWAYVEPDDRVRVVHVRDWHDPDDPAQRAHLARFGRHCLRDTAGAEFAFPVECDADKDIAVIDSLTLNDFIGTRLAEVLAPYAGAPHRVGLIGVWTEAKISFLAYELRTRHPEFELAVCSALTASESRSRHFEALDQLAHLLDVRVIHSVGEFVEFLGGAELTAPVPPDQRRPVIVSEAYTPEGDDLVLVRYLFRHCDEVELKILDGGYSGNVVASAHSTSRDGELVPHVVKIGDKDPIARERIAFERVEEVMGNNAPSISDFADYGARGAIKYRYASVSGTIATTFQQAYQAGMPLPDVARALQTVFGEHLARFYRAATLENCDLLTHYAFSSQWAASVRAKVGAILGAEPDRRELQILPGVTVPNLCHFYEQTLAHLPRRPGDQCYHAVVHGDLNGANIILDGHHNVWLIDFAHTGRGHILKDLIKLENDVLYIFTPVDSDDALRDACAVTDALLAVRDLDAPLPTPPQPLAEPFQRAWETVRILRGFYGRLVRSDRHPFQLWVGQLRYAAHTLGFDECTPLQKRWALYTAGRCAALVTKTLRGSTELRLDWLDAERTAPGRLALTLLPGRRDYGRNLAADLGAMTAADVSHVCCLVSTEELARYGVGDILAEYRARGWDVHHQPIVDQKTSSVADMRDTVAWLDAALQGGGTVVAHCVGGLGRTGLAVACWLRARGVGASDALAEVRRVRGNRAVETEVQESFVAAFGA